MTRCNLSFARDFGRDETSGTVMGMAVDVMREACREAGKNCVTISSKSCYNNTEQYSLGRWRKV